MVFQLAIVALFIPLFGTHSCTESRWAMLNALLFYNGKSVVNKSL